MVSRPLEKTGRGLSCVRACMALMLACLFIFSAVDRAQATSLHENSAKVNLFSLPLEQVLDIRVDGRTDSGDVRIIERQELKADVDTPSFTPVELSHSGEILLLIDGYRVGTLDSVEDLNATVSDMRDETARIEVYLGESVYWWSDENTQAVVNVVTIDRETEEVLP